MPTKPLKGKINTADRELTSLRNQLLELHQALLEHERIAYERKRGRVKGTRVFWEIVLNDPAFSWLHGLSELIVGIDGLLDRTTPPDPKNYKNLIAYTKKLLTPSRTGNIFAKKYYEAIQRDPTVTLSHGRTLKLLKRDRRAKKS